MQLFVCVSIWWYLIETRIRNRGKWVNAIKDIFMDWRQKRKSQLHILEQLCTDVELISKKNNSELVKSVKNLDDIDNRYVIVFDNSFDNLQVAMEQKLLKQYADKKDNCGLDYGRLSTYDKMKSVYEGTSLKQQFHAAGLEVVILYSLGLFEYCLHDNILIK